MAEDTSCDVHGEKKGQGRALGYYEMFSASLSEMCSSAIYWHAAVINTPCALEDDDVITACKIMARKQEVLQMCIVPTDQDCQSSLQFRFVPMKDPEKIDFESVTIKSKDDWPTLTSKYHNEHKININNGPIWRIILARVVASDENLPEAHQYVILLKFIHTIVDGLSVFDLLNRQFMPILSAVINGDDAENIIHFIPQTKSIEDIFPHAKTSLSCTTKLQLDFLRWKHRTFKPAQFPVYMFPDETPSLSKEIPKEVACIPKIFGEDICVSVMAAAKQHGVTVHCVLLSASALALARTAKQADAKLPETFVQAWPISLRKHLDFKWPLPLGYFGSDGTTVHESVTDYTVEKFWTSCGKLQKHVQQESRLDKCVERIRGFKYLVNAAQKSDLVTVLSEMGPPPNLFLSNLGNTDAVQSYQGNTNDNPEVNLKLNIKPDTDLESDKDKGADLKRNMTTDDDSKDDMNIYTDLKMDVKTYANLRDQKYTNAELRVNKFEGNTTAHIETAKEAVDTSSTVNATEKPMKIQSPMKIQVSEQYFHLTGLAETNFCPLTQFMLTFEKKFMWNIGYNPNTVSRKFVETYLENLEDVFKSFCRDENDVCRL